MCEINQFLEKSTHKIVVEGVLQEIGDGFRESKNLETNVRNQCENFLHQCGKPNPLFSPDIFEIGIQKFSEFSQNRAKSFKIFRIFSKWR